MNHDFENKWETVKINLIIRGDCPRLLVCVAFVLLFGFTQQHAGAAVSTTGTPAVARPVSIAVPSSSASIAGVVQANSIASNLHLVVGRSIFLKSTARLHRIYVSNPNILQSFISSPNQVIVTAKLGGTSSLALWDEAGHSVLYTISADIDVDALRHAVQQALPGQSIQIEAREGRVYLSGTVLGEDSEKTVLKLASSYSKDVVNSLFVVYIHPKQVRLKVRIVEVDRTKLAQFGFNFFSTGTKSSVASTQQFNSVGLTQGQGGQAAIGLSSPLNLFFFDSKLNVGATIADLASHNVAQILAEPTITTVSGHEGQFLSGGEFPYPVIQGGAGNFASVTIMFQPYGVRLKFTPTVNEDGTILLNVAPEVSALDYTNSVTISGYTIPAISTRRAETEVELRNGESFSISGLLDHRTTVLLSKMPGIGDVPVLGQLFKSKNNSHSVEELVVIVTATVVDPLHHAPNPVAPKMSLPNLSASTFDRQNLKGKP